jgi:hypothetical protein
MKIYTNTEHSGSPFAIEMKIDLFRSKDGDVRMVITDSLSGIESGGTYSIDSDKAREIADIIIDTEQGGSLDMNLDRAEKYSDDPTQCPHHHQDGGCYLSRQYECKRRNDFGYCSATYGER